MQNYNDLEKYNNMFSCFRYIKAAMTVATFFLMVGILFKSIPTLGDTYPNREKPKSVLELI